MDEPHSALDKQLRELMQIELRHLPDKLGMTTIYVTHDQREALTMSDRIAVIHGGRVQQLDTPRAIYEHPANRFVAEFIGESAFLKVERVDGGFRCAGQPLTVPKAPAADGALLLMLRPERLRILAGEADASQNVLAAQVTDVIYQGDTFLVQAALADGSRVSARGIASSGAMARAPQKGAAVRLALDVQDTVLIADADG
jgi:putative spermidine/putrescine transport system ATP-binding protein